MFFFVVGSMCLIILVIDTFKLTKMLRYRRPDERENRMLQHMFRTRENIGCSNICFNS
jgi:hypothetical protein